MTQTASRPRSRLGEILESEGRKQVWLADQIGVTRALVSSWCNGLHVPEDRRPAIAEALGREIADVFPEAGA